MTPVLVFDIETIPDIAGLRRLHNVGQEVSDQMASKQGIRLALNWNDTSAVVVTDNNIHFETIFDSVEMRATVAGLVLSGHTDTVPFDAALWSCNPL